MKYIKRKDYGGIEIDPKIGLHRIACCDCGLVHDIDFEANSDKPIKVIMTKNNRATGQLRRHRQISLIYK